MPIGEPTMPTGEDKENDMETIFARLKELDEKEVLTEEDVEWFKSGAIEGAFRSRSETLGNEDEDDEFSRAEFAKSEELELLHRRVAEKVEKRKEG